MAQPRCAIRFGLLLVFALSINLPEGAHAVPVVWTGPTISFMKTGTNTSDVNDPLNQDRMTSNVWLTRGSREGMFNIAKETAYDGVGHTSPADTLWATDLVPGNGNATIAASNWQQLTFTTWADAYGGPGSALIGNITTHNAVVKLVTDDIYLDLMFTGFSSGGFFTYDRSTGTAAPSPTGDYNHNGLVDGADYVIWRRTLTQSASPAGSGADGNSSGTIDPGDYTYWRTRFGNVGGAGAGLASIPEPAPVALGLELIAVVICTFRWRSLTTLRNATVKKSNCNSRRQPMTMLRIDSRCLTTALVIFTFLAGVNPTAKAAFHLWQIQEVFTNASGTVQFIEMHDNFSGETFTNGFTVTANSDGNTKTLTLTNLAHPTPGSLLLATSGFGSLPGAVTPDFTLPSTSFFNPNATNISISFSGSGDSISFTGASLPKNGVNSLTDTNLYAAQNLVSGTNSPMNLLGNTGSVNVPPPTGDYNGNHVVDAGDYVVWRKTLNNSASPAGSGADGNSSGTIDAGDYTYWRARFGNAAPGSGSLVDGPVPEPATVALQLGWLFAAMWRVRKRTTAREVH